MIKSGIVLLSFIFLAVHGGYAAGASNEDIPSIVEGANLAPAAKETLRKSSQEALAAGVPSQDVKVILRRGLSRGWDAESISKNLDLVSEAGRNKLPTRPLLNRVEQGLSKGVPPERVMEATLRLSEKLEVSSRMAGRLEKEGLKTAGQNEKTEAVQTIAWALDRSVPEDTVEDVGRQMGSRGLSFSRFTIAVSTLTTFTEMGMPVDRASLYIHRAVEKGYSVHDMMRMERDVTSVIRQGWTMGDAMRQMDAVMNRAGAPGKYPGMGAGGAMHKMPAVRGESGAPGPGPDRMNMGPGGGSPSGPGGGGMPATPGGGGGMPTGPGGGGHMGPGGMGPGGHR
jgi:hypothetical protein